MLVLKRKIGEAIVIGNDVEVVLLGLEGDAVKIGISAPRSIPVYRKEIHEEIKLANQGALAPLQVEELKKQFQKNKKNKGIE